MYILNIKIETMQLTKIDHHEDDSLFPQQLLQQQLSSPSHPEPHHKTSPSLKQHHQFLTQHDNQHVLANIDSNQLRFYQQYKKIYIVSHHLSLEKQRQTMMLENLTKRIHCLEEKIKDTKWRDAGKKELVSDQNKAKRSRRTAEQIQKKYKCEVIFCQRLYGSQGSLQQHIKLKHPELYQKLHSQDSLILHSHDSLV